jgi:phosphonate transport system substrate-binding protein
MSSARILGISAPSCRLVSLLAVAAMALAGCGRDPAPGRESLVITVPPTGDAAAQAKAWAPFLADMGEAVGVETQTFFGGTDTARIDALKFGQADLGWFDNRPGLEAVRRADTQVFARASRLDGSDAYRVALLTRKGSNVTLERLLACDRRLTLGLGEDRSSIETQALLTFLFGPRGQAPEACFKSVREAKAEANIFGVSAGVLDAAGAATTAMTEVAETDRAALANVETVWASPLITDDPIVWRRDLDPALRDKVARFLYAYGKGEGRKAERQREVLEGLGLRGFARTDDGHFLVPRQLDAAERLRRAKSRHDEAGAARAQAELEALAAEGAKSVR